MYIYQAALYCNPCGRALQDRLEGPQDPDDESTYDSDDFPKGPYGPSESDTPDHCDACQEFLENPLTDEGYRYVEEQLNDSGDRLSDTEQLWANFYGFSVSYVWSR